MNFSNAHTAGVYCAPSRAAIFSGQFASTTGCYQSSTYFVEHPQIESLQTSFTKAGYATFGGGKLFHHSAGNIDTRNWTEFSLRNPGQRHAGWPMDSWSRETPFPYPFPASSYNAGQEISGGLFLEWAPIPNDQEENLADTQRANWAVKQLQEKHDQPFFLGVGFYARITRIIVRKNILISTKPIKSNCHRSRRMIWPIYQLIFKRFGPTAPESMKSWSRWRLWMTRSMATSPV